MLRHGQDTVCQRLLFKTGRMRLSLSRVRCPAHHHRTKPCSFKTRDAALFTVLFPDHPHRVHTPVLSCTSRTKSGSFRLFDQTAHFKLSEEDGLTINDDRVYHFNESWAMSHSSLTLLTRLILAPTDDALSTAGAWRTYFKTKYADVLRTELRKQEPEVSASISETSLVQFIDSYALPSPSDFVDVWIRLSRTQWFKTWGVSLIHL